LNRFYGLRKNIPTVNDQKGLRTLVFFESVDTPQEVVSLTIWDVKEDADAYEHNGLYNERMQQAIPMFSEGPTLQSFKVTVTHHTIRSSTTRGAAL
jgi:heme-degrading monooxygenase HmoA